MYAYTKNNIFFSNFNLHSDLHYLAIFMEENLINTAKKMYFIKTASYFASLVFKITF